MHTRLCRHNKTDGRTCRAPAMGFSAYCYFHLHHRQRQAGLRRAAGRAAGDAVAQQIKLCALSDAQSVLHALSAVVNALAEGQLETRRAATLLHGLQLATSNVGHINRSQPSTQRRPPRTE